MAQTAGRMKSPAYVSETLHEPAKKYSRKSMKVQLNLDIEILSFLMAYDLYLCRAGSWKSPCLPDVFLRPFGMPLARRIHI